VTIARFFTEKINRSTGFSLRVVPGAKATQQAIFVRIDPKLALGDEGYTLNSSSRGVESVGGAGRAQGPLLLRLPCFELSVSGLLVECALSDTTEEVLLQENAFVREDATSRIGRLCTSREPIQSALEVQIYCGRIGVGVVRTNLLNKLAISWRSTVSDDDLIEGISLATVAL